MAYSLSASDLCRAPVWLAGCLSYPQEEAPALVGQALVPYYRQILPVLNIFIRKNKYRERGVLQPPFPCASHAYRTAALLA